MSGVVGAAAVAAGLKITAAPIRTAQSMDRAPALDCGAYSNEITRFREASDRGLNWLLENRQPDGTWPEPVIDLTGYFKVAYLFCIAGQLEEANRLISEIKNRFMQPNGDFKISLIRKGAEVDYYEKVWGYANAWITFTAHKLGRFDVSYPAWDYLERLYQPTIGGYTSTDPDSGEEAVVDLLSTTHIGHTALYMGHLDRAQRCAEKVIDFERGQADRQSGMYLRMNGDGRYITSYPDSETGYYFLSTEEPGQLYFMAGYPIAFLALLYRQTAKPQYLLSAKRYFDFAENCTGVFDSHFSHKVAWGASILYNLTGERRYGNFAVKIAGLLVRMQHRSGAWFHDAPPYASYDQSAEGASWLRQISSEICDK